MRKLIFIAGFIFAFISTGAYGADINWWDEQVGIQVAETFNSRPDQVWDVTNWQENGANGTGYAIYEVKEHRLHIRRAPSENMSNDIKQDWPMFNIPSFEPYSKDAEGFGYYLEVRQERDLLLTHQVWINMGNYLGAYAIDFTLTTLEGKQIKPEFTEGLPNQFDYAIIPAGFKGFVTVSFEKVIYNAFSGERRGQIYDPNEAPIGKFGLILSNLDRDGFIMDDFFTFSTNPDFEDKGEADRIREMVQNDSADEEETADNDVWAIYIACAIIGGGALAVMRKYTI